MAGPWEKYQPVVEPAPETAVESGPWAKYQTASTAAPPVASVAAPVTTPAEPMGLGEAMFTRLKSGLVQSISGTQQMLGEGVDQALSSNKLMSMMFDLAGDPTMSDASLAANREALAFADEGAGISAAARADSEYSQHARGTSRPKSFMDALTRPGNAAEYYGGIVSESAGPMLAAMATRNPEMGALLMGEMAGAPQYSTSRAEGRGVVDSFKDATAAGLIEGSLGLSPLGQAFKKGPLAKRIAATTAAEAGTEGITNPGQLLAVNALRGKSTPPEETLASLIDGMVAGTVMGPSEALLGGGGESSAAPNLNDLMSNPPPLNDAPTDVPVDPADELTSLLQAAGIDPSQPPAALQPKAAPEAQANDLGAILSAVQGAMQQTVGLKGNDGQQVPMNSPLGDAQAEPAPKQEGVPVMITAAMRGQLQQRGLSAADIGKLKPAEAWDILNSEPVRTEGAQQEPTPEVAGAPPRPPAQRDVKPILTVPHKDKAGNVIKDTAGRPMRELAWRKENDDLMTWIASEGGITEEVAREAGIDPAAFAGKGNIIARGVPNGTVIRKNGGMTADQLLERMQQEEWVSRDPEQGQATGTHQDAYDLLWQASNGRLLHPHNSAGEAIQRQESELYDQEMADFDDAKATGSSLPRLRQDISRANAQEADRADLQQAIQQELGESPVTGDDLGRYSPAELADMVRTLKADRWKDHVNGTWGTIQNAVSLKEREADLPTVRALIDLDNFKQVNDTLGHAFGDVMLREVGDILGKHLGTDLAFRMGGDEYVGASATPESLETAIRAAQDEIAATTFQWTNGAGEVIELNGVGLSFGIGNDLEAADAAQSQNKKDRADAGLRTERSTADRRQGQDVRTAPEGGSVRRGDERAGDPTGRDGEATGRVNEPTAQQSLLPAATPREVTKGAERAKDDQRNGRNSSGRSDMLAGDGELFAGARPEQTDIENDQPKNQRREQRGEQTDASRKLAGAVNRHRQGEGDRGEESRFRQIATDSLPDALRTALRALEKATGTTVAVFRNLTPKAFAFNGVSLGDGVLYVDQAADKPATLVASHEFVHQLKRDQPALYEELEAEIRRQGRLDAYGKKLKAEGETRPGMVAEELTADAVADALTDPDFLRRLAERDQSAFQRVARAFLEFLDTLLDKISNRGTNEYLADVQAFRDKLVDVLDRVGKGEARSDAGPVFQRVFHGTPHRGIEQTGFSLQKIGTGEGNQAFGWGIYFSGRRDIADFYRKNVKNNAEIERINQQMSEASREASKYETTYRNYNDVRGRNAIKRYDELMTQRDELVRDEGHLYNLEIPDDTDLIDFDKPMSAQPAKVKQLLRDAGLLKRMREAKSDFALPMNTRGAGKGENLYALLAHDLGSEKAASQRLDEIGIPGMRYKAGQIAGVKSGATNYVIWHEPSITDVQPMFQRREASDQTNTPAFKRLFGDSKVVDQNGDPLMVYHGTPKGDIEFTQRERGNYFTSSKNLVDGYTRGNFLRGGRNGAVYPVYLSLQNPMVIDALGKRSDNIPVPWLRGQWKPKVFGNLPKGAVSVEGAFKYAIDNGYDGLIVRNVVDTATSDGRAKGDVYVSRDVEQIISAFDNNGELDPKNPDIRMQRRDKLESPAGDLSPAQREFMRKAGMADAVDTRTSMQRVTDWAAGKLASVKELDSDEGIQATLDRFHGIAAAVRAKGNISVDRNPYIAARLSTGTASTMEAILLFGAPKWEGGVLSIDRGTAGLLEAFNPVRDAMPSFLGWMVARRAEVMKKQGRENLMSDSDIAAGLSLAKGRESDFTKAALGYLKIKNAALKVAEEAGTINAADRALWDHAEYIPFYRDIDAGRTGTGTQQSTANQSAGIKRLTGDIHSLRDPLSNIIENLTRLIDSATKNRAALLAVDELGAPYFRPAAKRMSQATIPLSAIKKHLLDNGTPQDVIDRLPKEALDGVARLLAIEAPQGPDIVRVMRDGKAEYWHVDDPLLLRALTAFKEVDKNIAVKPLVWLKQLLTAGATMTPEFAVANTLRDTGEAWVTSRDGFIPLVDTLRGAAMRLVDSPLSQDLMMAGAAFQGGLFHTSDSKDTAKAIQRALRKGKVDDGKIKAIVSTLWNPARAWDVYRKLLESSEMGSRIILAQKRLDAGATKIEAMFEAKDFLDFSMRGDARFIELATDILPFLNARLQGNYRLARVGGVGGDVSRRAKLLGRMGVMAMFSTALYVWNMMNYADGYDELEEWDKDAYWHIGPGTDWHLRIPKPFEIGLVAGTGPERIGQAILYQGSDGEAGDRPDQSAMALFNALFHTLAINPIPQGVRPALESYVNHNFFTGRAIENMGDEQKLPEDRYTAFTSETMREVGRVTGTSPKQLQNLWRGYTAGMGMYLLDSSDWLLRTLRNDPEQPARTLRDYPLIGRFVRGGDPQRSTRQMSEFYDLKDEAGKRTQSIKEAVVRGDLARARNLETGWEWLLGQRVASKRAKGGFMHTNVQMMNKLANRLADARREDQFIMFDPKLTAEQKRARMIELTKARNAEVKKLVRMIYKAKHSAH